MEVIHEAPTAEYFTPLSVHQSRTPESFFSGHAVLYHHSPSASLLVHKSDLGLASTFAGLAAGAQQSANGTSGATNGHTEDEEEDKEISIPNVDVWVTSERFILFSLPLNTGLSFPYPSISLHAIQRPSSSSPNASLFLQVLAEAQAFDDHDPDSTISLTIVPAPAPSTSTLIPTAETEETNADTSLQTQSPTQALYDAVSSCANLHPDPMSGSELEVEEQHRRVMVEGDGDISGMYPLASEGGAARAALPPPMPGSGGWITAENIGDFFDEEGNWTGRSDGAGREDCGEGLGTGAGSVRPREEEDEDGENGEELEEETKWRRTL